MRRPAFAIAAAVLAAGAASAAEQTGFVAQEIVDAATGDWNKDGHQDLAVLAISNGEMGEIGIYAYLRDPERMLLQPVLSAPDTVWGSRLVDGMYGQEPSISALANGSIAVATQNSAVGRERWHQTLTIAWRGERFLVAGYTFSSYDTLDPDGGLECDLNLLTGKGTVDGSKVTFAALSLSPDEWKDDSGSNPGLDICRRE